MTDSEKKKTLSLKRPSLSRARSKTVVVETKRKRLLKEQPETAGERLALVQKKSASLSKYTKNRLSNSILKAAITDVRYDEQVQKIIAVPFDDVGRFSKNLEQERTDLVDALNFQAIQALQAFDAMKANINDEKLKEKLESYRNETANARPNPRILLRQGNIIKDQLLDPEIRAALNSWDIKSLDEFVSDHNELMRNHYSESLLRAQEVEAADVEADKLEDAADNILEAVDLLNKMSGEEGRDIVDAQILAILKDVADEITQYDSALESPLLQEDQKQKLFNRFLESVKNGAIFLGRISFFFTVVLISTSSAKAFSAAGSLASILGVIEVAKPGTIYWIYSKFRKAIPLLPDLPKPKE